MYVICTPGNQTYPIRKEATPEDLNTLTKDIFFPKGVSQNGTNINELDYYLATHEKQTHELLKGVPLTYGEIITTKKKRPLRIYLYTKVSSGYK